MSFENNTKVRMTHFDISVAVNATVIIRNPHILNEKFHEYFIETDYAR